MATVMDKIAANGGKILASPQVQKTIEKTGEAILKTGAKVIDGLIKAFLR